MRKLFIALLLISFQVVVAQTGDGYKMPPKDVADLLLAKPTPSVSIDGKAEWMLLSERNPYPTVEELGQPELRIAGLRLNPSNFAPSRQVYINNFKLKNIKTGKEVSIAGLPENLLATNISWSPAEKKIAFLNTAASRVDLYVIDLATQKVTRLNKQAVNNTLGTAYTWIDDNTILYKATTAAASAAPKKSITPKGPAIQENMGKAAPSATFQDLIKTPYDEDLFQFYGTSQLIKNTNGVETKIATPAIYLTTSLSPDKKYMMTRTIRKPFSYLVTVGGFPTTVSIRDMTGKVVKQLAELPSSEGTPSGYDNTQNVPRGFDWRDDEAATIVWAQPLDSGLIKKKVEFHDAVYSLSAPFTGSPKELFKTTMRYRGISWGDATLALIGEGLRSKQTQRMSRYNPSTGAVEKLYDINQTDAYNNPGNPVTKKNSFGREVIITVDNGTKLLMNNTTGSSAKGDLPFLAKYDLATKKNEIVWRCAEGTYEFVTDVLDPQNLTIVTRKETQTEVPNYFIKDLVKRIADRPITDFKNPYPQLAGVTKQKVFYKRADGID